MENAAFVLTERFALFEKKFVEQSQIIDTILKELREFKEERIFRAGVSDSEAIKANNRVTKLETVVQNAIDLIKDQGSNIKDIVNEIQAITQNVSDHIAATSKTNWGTLASWSAVVLTVVTLAGFGFIRDIARLEESYKTVLWEEVIPYLREGHVPVLATKIEQLEARMNHIDTKIDEEIKKVMDWHREQIGLIEHLHEKNQKQ